MNTLNAIDLKRRGITAIEAALAFVPVHIMKHNQPAAVVLRESEYQHRVQKKSCRQNVGAAQWIMDYKPAGNRSKEDIDRQIADEHRSWETQEFCLLTAMC
jgi:hypothetical protein